MRHPNLDPLQTPIAIADLGTFAAAARALHLAHPAVSLHIKALEFRMQTALVVRGRRQAEQTRRRTTRREGLVKVGVSARVSTRLLL